ncbi:hypothetical protein Tco_0679075 [Tanacetum coccineum]|uniref:Uncharacterized protein n=1 Tax=Tanacetum coccineum TaxID=301880 RepID=A0ABQ4XGV1_9ASTR
MERGSCRVEIGSRHRRLSGWSGCGYILGGTVFPGGDWVLRRAGIETVRHIGYAGRCCQAILNAAKFAVAATRRLNSLKLGLVIVLPQFPILLSNPRLLDLLGTTERRMWSTVCDGCFIWNVKPQSHSPGTSSRTSHSPGNTSAARTTVILARSAQNLGMAECSNCMNDQVDFQTRNGRFFAAADNMVYILDVETQAVRHSLQKSLKRLHEACYMRLQYVVSSQSFNRFVLFQERQSGKNVDSQVETSSPELIKVRNSLYKSKYMNIFE